MFTTRRLLIAIATLTTLSAFIAVSGAPATAQPTPDAAVLALEAEGVLTGTDCSPEDCEGDLRRWEAALWLTNALGLSTEAAVSFHDGPADGELAAVVSALYSHGVTVGCSAEPLRYCPDDHTSRAQMASFLARAFDLEANGSGGFADVDPDSVHAPNISAIWEAGITRGCAQEPLRYCPRDPITREQAAVMLYRALQRFDGFADSATMERTNGPTGPTVGPTAPTTTTTAPTVPTTPTTTAPTAPTTPTTAPTVPTTPTTAPTVPTTPTTAPTAPTTPTTTAPTVPTAPTTAPTAPTTPTTTAPTAPTTPTTTAPTAPTTPTTTAPTAPTTPTTTVPTVSPVPPGCAVVDHFNTSHDIDDHGGDPTEQAWALLADGTLFAHRHVPGGGALCWMWAPSSPDEEPPFPQNVRPPSHTH